LFPLDIPPGATLESLVTETIPAAHARWVDGGGSTEVLLVAVRIEGLGAWTFRIQGGAMRAEPGEAARPTLWVYTTAASAERFLADALGPRRLMPKVDPKTFAESAPKMLSDPRVIRRVAMASGRLEVAVVDEDGARLAVVFGFGDAARKTIDPDDPDTVVEVPIATLDGILRGERAPEEALAAGDVAVRGRRLLAMQLALAVGPLYPKR
jgi:hypothetical protein